MKHVFTYRDCVAWFDAGEYHSPTEWELFPIHHADPFWNAELFN